MKRIVLAVLVMVFIGFTGLAQAQTWVPTNAITVAWDAVTVPSGTVSYKLYIKPATGGTESFAQTVTGTTATVSFPVEGRYYIGVRTVRSVDGIELESSNIGWSNDAAYVMNGATFGAQYYIAPGNITGLRIQ